MSIRGAEWRDESEPIDWCDGGPAQFRLEDGQVIDGEIVIDDDNGMPIAAFMVLGKDGRLVEIDRMIVQSWRHVNLRNSAN